MEIRELVTSLAATLRDEVLPHLGAHAGRAHSGEAAGGDVTFRIDEHAEERMEGFLAERAPEVSFDMTRIATGQLDAYIEPGPRIIDEIPALRSEFERIGRGSVLNNSPYDLAAAALCLEEAGAIVTDAFGKPLRDRPLLGSSHEYQMSCVAAANPELHVAICEAIDAGIERLRVVSGA